MAPNDANSDAGTAFCINCGEEISSDTDFCPECGSSQNPESLETVEESDTAKNRGFTSWAIGFKPGKTGRNVLVGIAYLLFLGIGIPLLIYAYLVENPEKTKYVSVLAGVLFILVGLGTLADGSIRGIVAGVIAIIIGVLFIPQVREKLSIGSPPGISEGNTARRNLLTSIGYGIGGVIIIGAIAPETESSSLDTDGGSNSGGGGGAESSGGSESTSGPEFAASILYSGSWQGALSVTGGGSSTSESISGTGTQTIEITGDVDIISVNAQKQDDSAEELAVQILYNGDVAAEASTTSEYGVAQTSESF